MTKQLNMRPREVHFRAHCIGARLGKPLAEAILIVVRKSESRSPAIGELTLSQRDTYEMFDRLPREAAKHKLPGATADHKDMCDELGLSSASAGVARIPNVGDCMADAVARHSGVLLPCQGRIFARTDIRPTRP